MTADEQPLVECSRSIRSLSNYRAVNVLYCRRYSVGKSRSRFRQASFPQPRWAPFRRAELPDERAGKMGAKHYAYRLVLAVHPDRFAAPAHALMPRPRAATTIRTRDPHRREASPRPRSAERHE